MAREGRAATLRSARGSAVLVAVLVAFAAAGFARAAEAARPRATNPQTACERGVYQLENPGFEAVSLGSDLMRFFPQNEFPAWSTTAPDGMIEVWQSGFSEVSAAEGSKFIELNANFVAAIYQDVATEPGTVITWSLSHRGRMGTDTMRVLIGKPSQTLVQQSQFSDGTSAWGRHSGTYVVPVGQTCTRFQFESLPSAGSAPSVGNFLDAISFGAPANIVSSLNVAPNGPVNVGATLGYTVSAHNDGGSATRNAVVSAVLPVGVTFVPGSITMDTGNGVVAVPDSAYDANTRTISVQLVGSSGAAGVIEPGQTASLTFDAVVDSGAAGGVLAPTATVTSTDGQGVVTSGATAPATTVVNTSTDVLITLDATGSAQAGDAVSITATVANAGPLSAFIGPNGEAAATAVISVPSAIVVTPASVPAECVQAGQVFTCTRTTTLPVTVSSPSLTWKLPFAGTISPSAVPATLITTAIVSSYSSDFSLGNNSVSAATVIVPPVPATLQVVKNVLTPTVTAGNSASINIKVTNTGQLATNSVTLTDTIPTGFTVTSATPTVGSCVVGTAVTCALGVLTGGQSITVQIAGTTDAGLAAGSVLADTATATDGTTSDTDTGTISTLAASHLVTTKEVTGESVVDKPVTYLVTVTNLGPSAAANAEFEDVLPAGTTLVSTPAGCAQVGQKLTCALGKLAVGQASAVTYQLNVPAGGTITNAVSASSDSTPVNASDASTSVDTKVRTDADVRIEQIASKSVMQSGDTVELQFRVTNDGPVAASGITVTNTAPAGLEYLTGRAGGNPLQPGQPVFWDVGTLASGATVSAGITARLTGKPGDYINTVTAQETQVDPASQNNSASVTLSIREAVATTTTTTGVPNPPEAESAESASQSSGALRVAGARLAQTGSSITSALGIGLALSVGGAMLMWAVRRRDEGCGP
ncbi:MAG: hypothetical protein ACOYN3_10015 [Acidimicrobiia bacterium]